MRLWITSIVGFLGGTMSFVISMLGFVGWVYWMWMAIQFGNFWMFLFAFLGPAGLIAALLGAWSLLFGVPAWLVSWVS